MRVSLVSGCLLSFASSASRSSIEACLATLLGSIHSASSTAKALRKFDAPVDLAERQSQTHRFEPQLIVEFGQQLPVPSVASSSTKHLDLDAILKNDHVLFQALHLLVRQELL